MYELYHLAAAYVIGSAAALWLFRKWTQERIVTATLDTLIEQGYLLSYQDEDGVTQLSKWREEDLGPSDLDILDDLSGEEIEAILQELIEEDAKKKNEEQDDTP
jgi:hypothetical protein